MLIGSNISSVCLWRKKSECRVLHLRHERKPRDTFTKGRCNLPNELTARIIINNSWRHKWKKQSTQENIPVIVNYSKNVQQYSSQLQTTEKRRYLCSLKIFNYFILQWGQGLAAFQLIRIIDYSIQSKKLSNAYH